MTRDEASTHLSGTGLLTLDVEDWYHANFAQMEGRAPEVEELARSTGFDMSPAIDRWVEITEAAGATSTCFVLGEFAERYPDAVRRLHDAGHEVASHSYSHDLIYEMDRPGFARQLARSVGVLGDITGTPPLGFRAPSWSVDTERTPWFVEELLAAGFRYDSSEFPVRTNLYGSGSAPLEAHHLGGLLRVPATAVYTAGRVRIPFLSGAFLRLMPRRAISFGLNRMLARGETPMAILHPRELLQDHPRLPLGGWEGRVHYARLATTTPKLEMVLRRCPWTSIARAFFPTTP